MNVYISLIRSTSKLLRLFFVMNVYTSLIWSVSKQLRLRILGVMNKCTSLIWSIRKQAHLHGRNHKFFNFQMYSFVNTQRTYVSFIGFSCECNACTIDPLVCSSLRLAPIKSVNTYCARNNSRPLAIFQPISTFD